jgi:hypothetical protein
MTKDSHRIETLANKFDDSLIRGAVDLGNVRAALELGGELLPGGRQVLAVAAPLHERARTSSGACREARPRCGGGGLRGSAQARARALTGAKNSTSHAPPAAFILSSKLPSESSTTSDADAAEAERASTAHSTAAVEARMI